MKTYLHELIEILQLISRGKNKKVFNITSKYLSIFNNKPPASEARIQQEIF